MDWINSVEEMVLMNKEYLDKLRKEIDQLDREISLLIQKRMDLVSEVVEYKRNFNKGILDKSREDRVLENVMSVVSNPLYSDSIRAVFESIMESSREYQTKHIQSSKKPKKRYALIGEKLSHSLSSKIHGLFFQIAGIDAVYEHIEIPSHMLTVILKQLKKDGFNGINVTIPYKTDIMASLNTVSSIADRVGAVNTIEIGEEFRGYNTDYFGFGRSLEYYNFDIRNKSCAVLGSGGSSKAAISYLEDSGTAEIAIVTRDTKAAEIKFPGKSLIQLKEFSAKDYDLIINATPVGMYPIIGASPISKEQLYGASFVFDLIYNPEETLLLKYAKELGIPCANGLYMLVAQAISAQEIWQGVSYEQDIINNIYDALLN